MVMVGVAVKVKNRLEPLTSHGCRGTIAQRHNADAYHPRIGACSLHILQPVQSSSPAAALSLPHYRKANMFIITANYFIYIFLLLPCQL